MNLALSKRIITFAPDDGSSVTTSEMAQKTGIKFRTLQRHISQLQEMGFLSRKGSRKDGEWVVILPNM